MKKSLIKYGLIFLGGHILFDWLLHKSNFDIPRYIPKTPINIEGFLLIIFIVIVFILLNRELISKCSPITIGKLLTYSILIYFIAEIIFQLYRLPFLNADTPGERFHYYLIAVFGTTLFASIIAFFVVFQMKTKKTNLTILFIVGLMTIMYFSKDYILNITKH